MKVLKSLREYRAELDNVILVDDYKVCQSASATFVLHIVHSTGAYVNTAARAL